MSVLLTLHSSPVSFLASRPYQPAFPISKGDDMRHDEPSFTIHTLELGPMENFIYLIKDKATNRTAVVDPAWEVPEIVAKAKAEGMQITDILLTHSHHDHINGIDQLLESFDAQIHLLKPEAKFWGNYPNAPKLHHGGDEISIGETKVRCMHTPGHTPGSCCYHVGEHLIAGDTLFVFGCGRCDLAGGDPNQMFDSLRRIQTELPPQTRLHPGHNYSVQTTTTLDEEIAGNPFMHFDDREAFRQYRMVEHDRTRHSPYGPVPK